MRLLTIGLMKPIKHMLIMKYIKWSSKIKLLKIKNNFYKCKYKKNNRKKYLKILWRNKKVMNWKKMSMIIGKKIIFLNKINWTKK
jgi:hypothetical protein